MSVLNLDEIKGIYENKHSAEAKLIIELATMLKDEIESGSRSQEVVRHFRELLEREQSIVDRLLAK